MDTIQVNTPFNHIVTPQVVKTVSEITITHMTDNPIDKMVSVRTKELGRVVLWKDAEYDAIGQWTDSDVEARLHELFGQ